MGTHYIVFVADEFMGTMDNYKPIEQHAKEINEALGTAIFCDFRPIDNNWLMGELRKVNPENFQSIWDRYDTVFYHIDNQVTNITRIK